MLKGTLIVNAFLDSPQTTDTYEHLIEAAKRHNIDMDLRTNGEFFARVDKKGVIVPKDFKSDFVLFWNKDVALGYALEAEGYRLYNPSEAIRLCDNKAATFEAITNSSYSDVIRMPRTIRIPMTFAGIGYTNYDFIDAVIEEMGLPFVLKECWGSYGGQVYLANTKEEAVKILSKMDGQDVIAQEYISSSKGRDIRAYIVGGKLVAAIERRNDNDFRANITNGGTAIAIKLNKEQEEMAIAATKALEMDFAGVDLLHMKDGAPILCEVNSNAQFAGLYKATGIDVTDAIMEHISCDRDINCI